MSTEGYADFLHRLGHRVRRVRGRHWFDVHPHIYASFPFADPVAAEDVDCEAILGSDGWAARMPCAVEDGRPSYQLVVREPNYGMEILSGKARNQTRRGLEICEVGPIDFVSLAERALPLCRDTLVRQRRRIGAGFEAQWRRYFAAAAESQGAEAWAASVEGRLAAFLVAFRMQDAAHVLIVRSAAAELKHYPNNALYFGYLSRLLKGGEVTEVSIGLESIQGGMHGLDHFKEGMGFQARPIGQRVVLRAAIGRLLDAGGLGVARSLLRDGWGSERLGKAAGLLRWYQEQPRRTGWPG